jgi:DNA-binding transcriptional ArsR family regulator
MDGSIFAALADPTRRHLLANLARNSPRTATQLAEEYHITRQGLLKHLNILEDAGLVTAHQQGRERRYVLRPEPLTELDRWLRELSEIWDQRLFRLKALVESAEAKGPRAASGKALKATSKRRGRAR